MPEPRAPWGALAALGAVVLAVHVWALSGAPVTLHAPRAATWLARTITPEPVVQAAQAAVSETHVAPPPSPTPIAPVVKPAKGTAPPGAKEKAQATTPAPTDPTPTLTPTPASEAVALVAQRASAPAASARAFVVAPSATYHYVVSTKYRGFDVQGEGALQWRHDGHEYTAVLELWSAFTPRRTQRSTGQVTPEGLAPTRFADRRRSEEAAHFQRDQGRITFSSNQPDAVLEPGAQDRLSVILQLGAMLAGAPQRFRPGTAISLQVASARDAQEWVFTVEAAEPLKLPGGTVQAIRLIRNPRKEYDQKVELWLAPGAAYAPVRVRLTQPNGDSYDLQWSSTDRG